jgi:phage terminase Nu1 subunit (DNA packaging protein)
MGDIATTAELADLFGVSTRTVRDLAKRGIAVRRGRNYVRDESTRRYCKHLRELATGRGGEAAITSATAERARLVKMQADQVELKNAALRGSMLDAGAVEREWSDVLRGVRAGLLAVPSRVAQRLPHLTPHDVAEIAAEVRVVLTELGQP